MPAHFRYYTKKDVLALTRIRRYETRLGERLAVISEKHSLEEWLQQEKIRYVVLGIPEDIGIKGNLGTGGADTLWKPFLHAWLNTQSNDFLTGEQILLLGHFDFSDLKQIIETNAQSAEERVEAYRHAVLTIDAEVEELIKKITACKKIPVVIGGGHNNAYPLIKGAAKGLSHAGLLAKPRINAVNLDAHSDYRAEEGRHSGNAFRYAKADGFLNKYCAVGVHENYLPQGVWMDLLNDPAVDLVFYEDIFLREKRTFLQAVAHATTFTEDTYTGVELDLDSIEQVLSSAETPSGVTVLQARQYLNYVATDARIAYVHLCEGAQQLEDGTSSRTTGKLVSYLVTDFIKAYEEK